MFYPALAVLVGIVVLVAGADRFVGGAAGLARHFGVPSLLVGIVIVGFGTSVPEMIVSATAAIRGAPGIALGNAYGSNITNITLILGLSAVIRPLLVDAPVIRRELPLLLAATVIAIVLLMDDTVSRLDATIMVAAFAASLFITIRQSLNGRGSAGVAETARADGLAEEQPPGNSPPWRPAFWVAIGLTVMIAGSELLTSGAVSIAEYFGVSDLVIGLTIVAVGTSLPELASSVVAARKQEDDLALGNIIGSNIFNALLVVGAAGIIHPLAAEPELMRRDMPVMAAVTALLFLFCLGKHGRGRLSRPEGAFLLALYIAYTVYLILTSLGSAA